MAGTLYGIGDGPGDPELMTLKAVTIRRSAVTAGPKAGSGDRVALHIARQAVPELTDKTILGLEMPMTKDPAVLRVSHETAADRITDILDSGADVAFLTLGDPTIYATYIYVHRLVRSKGYMACIVPGGPSICAVAAQLGDSLADTSQPIHIIPGSYGDVRESLRLKGTKVLMKSGKAFPAVKAALQDLGLLEKAKMVTNCGMADERVYDSLAETAETSGYFSIIVVKE